jgi:hypothetical protein
MKYKDSSNPHPEKGTKILEKFSLWPGLSNAKSGMDSEAVPGFRFTQSGLL